MECQQGSPATWARLCHWSEIERSRSRYTRTIGRGTRLARAVDMFARTGVVRSPGLKRLHVGSSVESELDSEQPLVLRAHARPGLRAASNMRKPALLVALGLVLGACSGSTDDSSDDKGEIWNGDSARIDFELTGATGQRLCEFSATREELTEPQLDGLASLRLHESTARAGCDTPTYSITIHGGDGSSVRYLATHVDCSSSPILLFEDFDAWAKGSPCSLQP